MPACGVTPEAIPNAIASGRATNPTVTPAIRSDVKSCLVYPARKHKTDFGIHFLFSDVTIFLERSKGISSCRFCARNQFLGGLLVKTLSTRGSATLADRSVLFEGV